jgi:head-tail adaptor
MPDDPSGGYAATLGALRWRVTLYRRDQSPADDLALAETLVPLATVWANIQPSRPSTLYQSTQIDGPVTHMIDIRWQDYPATIDVVARSRIRPDGTGLRTELFRVRRSTEIGGRLRFIRMECELEHSRTTPDDGDGTRNALLTEPYDGAAAAPPGINPL